MAKPKAALQRLAEQREEEKRKREAEAESAKPDEIEEQLKQEELKNRLEAAKLNMTAEQFQDAVRKLATDRAEVERQLAENARRETELRQKEQAIVGNTTSLTEWQQALEKREKKLKAGKETGETELKRHGEDLDAREALVKKWEEDWAIRNRGLAEDINYLISVIGILRDGGGKEKKAGMEEFGSHQWRTITVEK